MNFLGHALDYLGEIFLRFLTDIPVLSFPVSEALLKVRTYLGYVNYFVPFNVLNTLWSANVLMIEAFVFGMLLVYYIKNFTTFGK